MKITHLKITTSVGMAALALTALPVLPVQTAHAAPAAASDANQSATANIYIIQVSGGG